MKKFLSILLLSSIALPANAQTLWQYYGGNMPSIETRAVTYNSYFDDEYRGTFMQNVNLAKILESEQDNQNATLGAVLPSATAVFETSLAAPITLSATTMTLAANAVRGGGVLSGYQCFTLDEGNSQAETVCGMTSATTVTGMTRGISQANGTTTVAALMFPHRRGTNVKITDFPVIQILKAQNNGEDVFESPIHYSASLPTSTIAADRTNIPSVGLVQDIAFNGAGVISATTLARGVSELATQTESASSTVNGSSGPLVIPASSATSTYNAATAGLRIISTQNNGKIDNNFISTTTLLNNLMLSTSTNIGSFPAWQIGKQIQVFTSVGTTTFSVPSGITKIFVRIVAGGGNNPANTSNVIAAGAGAGGYAERFIDVTGTSTIQLYVGNNTQWSTFGTNGFYMSAQPGQSPGTGGLVAGGTGGSATGGDINITGGSGGNSLTVTGIQASAGMLGGSSFFGGPGAYGSAATQGIVIVTW